MRVSANLAWQRDETHPDSTDVATLGVTDGRKDAPGQATTWFAYDLRWNRVSKILPPLRDSMVIAYDSVTGNRTSMTDAAGNTTTFAYQPGTDLVEAVCEPGCGNAPVRYFYNVLGQLDSLRTERGGKFVYRHDAFGNVDTIIDPRGMAVRKVFTAMNLDSLSVRYSVADANADTLGIKKYFDLEGRMIEMDLLGEQVLYTPKYFWRYDGLGRLQAKVDPLQRADSLVYDEGGNLLEEYTRRQLRIDREYDDFNRLTKVYLPAVPGSTLDGPITIPADVAEYHYDAAGNMILARDGDSEVDRTYNLDGSLRGDTVKLGALVGDPSPTATGARSYGFSYTYDRNGRLRDVAYPAAPGMSGTGDWRGHATYTYGNRLAGDPRGLLGSILDPLSNTFSFTRWDERGRLARLDFPQPSGRYATYGYYPDNSLFLHEVPGVFGDTLLRDTVGNLRKRVRVGQPNSMPDSVVSLYDPYGRLKESTTYDLELRMGSQLIGWLGERFNYDALDNRIADARRLGVNDPVWHARTHLYTSAGRLDRIVDPGAGDAITTTFAYNDDGSLASEKDHNAGWGPNATTAFDTAQSSYDALGRLVRLDRKAAWGNSGSQSAGQDRIQRAYRYDAIGRRIADYNVLSPDPYPGTRYLYVGDYEAIQLQVLSGTGADTTSTLLSRNPLDGTVLASLPSGAVGGRSYYYRDEQGTAVNSSNYNGQLGADPVRYSAYGMPLNAEASDGSGHGYTNAAVADSLTGLLYLRNRFYDPNTGRFTQEDPLGFAGGINLYAYVGGNPASWTDPFGLKLCFDPNSPNYRTALRETGNAVNMDLEVDQNGCVSGAHARGNSSSYAMAQYDFLRLIEAPATYSVYFVDYGGFGSGFDPSNRRIAIDASAPHTITYAAYDPSTHTCTAPGEVETYAEIIAHELGHAYMSARGARPAPPWLGAPSGEEYVANAYQNMYLSGHKRNARCRY